MSRTYCLGGLKIASDLELPELMSWDGPSGTPADAVFCLDHVPPQLEAPDHVAPMFQTKGRNEYLLAVPGTGRFLVREGCEVTIEAEPGADPIAVRTFVTGPVQAVLWHQRGLLPLRASVVVVDGRAVALAGPSGMGKSTLAAVLAAMGHNVIADDICVIGAGKIAEASVQPGLPRLLLWRDALDRLGIPPEGLRRALSSREKYFVDSGQGSVCELHKLAALVVLVRQVSCALTIERLRGHYALCKLHSIVHVRRAARALGRDPDIFTALTSLAPMGVTVWQLAVPDNPACLDEAAAKVVAALQS